MQEMPHSAKAERAVLGCVLVAAERFLPELLSLTVDDFFIPCHREMWACIKALWDRKTPIDLVSVVNEADVRKVTQHFEGGCEEWCRKVVEDAAYWEHLSSHKKLIEDKAALRNAIKLCNEVTCEAYRADDPPSVMSSLRNGLVSIESSRANSGGPKLIKDTIDDALKAIKVKADNPNLYTMTTGLVTYDNVIDKIQTGQLIVVGGRPGMGKSAAGLGMAYENAQNGVPTAFFSLEMSRQELLERALSRASRVDSRKIKSGKSCADHTEWTRVVSAAHRLENYRLYIEDRLNKFSAIVSAMRRWHAREIFGANRKLGMVVIDYLQIIIPDKATKVERRDIELANMTRELKAMAVDLQVAVVLISQLNRQSEIRGGEPVLSDLRESGAIEQDADMVIFPYREPEGGAYFICAKNRGGTTGKVRCVWDGPTVSYRNSFEVLDEPTQQSFENSQERIR